MNTYKLKTGVNVLARPWKDGSLQPLTYMSHAQAAKSALKHNGQVYRMNAMSRCFYVQIDA